MNIYIELTREFNSGRLRAIISSGQAVVLHHFAVMSKDGDWILKEEDEAVQHVLAVLQNHGARYRFGAPLDVRWMKGGWSSHFEFMREGLRVRTDFVTRPPRISSDRLSEIWEIQERQKIPFVDLGDLAELKKTNREKDYAVIGELARSMDHIEDRLRFSRSARDIIALWEAYPEIAASIAKERDVLLYARSGLDRLEEALDAERRRLMHANEKRLLSYIRESEKWAEVWKECERATAGLSLLEAHRVIAEKALGTLPFKPDVKDESNAGDQR
jgi:hypothetical protein